MYSLLIDGALDYLEIALIKDEQIFDSTMVVLDKNLTKKLNPTIEEMVKKHFLSYQDISAIYVVRGPGSFTSIKLISLFANTFKFVHKRVKLYSINTLNWHQTEDDEMVFVDAKSGLHYVLWNHSYKPLIMYSEQIPNVTNVLKKYFYDFNNLKPLSLRWEVNKNNFIENVFVRPLYIKPAVYDSNKKNI